MSAIVRMLQNLEEKPRNEADALAIAIHTCLEEEGFRLLSVGEEIQCTSKAEDLVKIPSIWNATEDVYTFCYRHVSASGTFLFKLLLVDDTLIVHGASESMDDVLILELKYVGLKKNINLRTTSW